MFNMSESPTIIALTTFRAETAERQFCKNLSGVSHYCGITCFQKAIKDLRSTYVTSSEISEVLEDLYNIRQGEAELEEEYCKRLNQAVFRRGNIHMDDEKINAYINALSDSIRTVAGRYCQSVHFHELNFKSFAHFVKSEGIS